MPNTAIHNIYPVLNLIQDGFFCLIKIYFGTYEIPFGKLYFQENTQEMFKLMILYELHVIIGHDITSKGPKTCS